MKTIEHTTASGHKITVYDDVFDFAQRSFLMDQCRRLNYEILDPYDANLRDQMAKYTCKAVITENCLKDFFQLDRQHHGKIKMYHLAQLYNLSAGGRELALEIGKNSLARMWCNAGHHSDNPALHSDYVVDDGTKSMLTYLNLEWKQDWDGGTIFRTADGKGVELYVDYVPGRVVVFDSIIPHKPMTCSADSVPFRFTLNSMWAPEE
jgi:hypothetical protein